MSTKVIFVNGPPGSGKTTIGHMIVRILGGQRAAYLDMGDTLKRMTHALYGIYVGGPNATISLAPFDHFESRKDREAEEFFGRTPREVYIAVSERLLKTLHGPDFYGKQAVRLIEAAGKEWIAMGCGFYDEARPVVERFGAENCALLGLVRNGCDYGRDSRRDLYPHGLGISSARYGLFSNNYPLAEMEGAIRRFLEVDLGATL